MACPVNHCIPTGAYIPALLSEEIDVRATNVLFKDYYHDIYAKYGIARHEMMIVMPFVMHSDVLSGTERYEYYINEKSSAVSSSVKSTNERTLMKTIDEDSSVKKDEDETLVKNTSGIITSVYKTKLDPKQFNSNQQNKIDFEGLGRTFLKITVDELTEEYYEALKHLFKLQYKLEVKYLKPVPDACRYISQKTPLIGNNKDITKASITIEPLHGNIFNTVVPRIPINQKLKLGTVVNLTAETTFMKDDSDRKFLWSNNLSIAKSGSESTKKTNDESPSVFISGGESSKVKSDSASSLVTNNWLMNVHIGTIDVGSKIVGKFIVSNTDIQQSYSLFGFNRNDSEKYIILWIFNYYNITMEELIDRILKINKSPALHSYLSKVKCSLSQSTR